MDLTVLNKDFIAVMIFDSFESIIWTDRYFEAGDFEIYIPASKDLLNTIKKGYYLINNESEHAMVIESFEINTDSENGNKLIIRGRSLESILDRRIVWNQTIIEGGLQAGIKKLITESIINPTIVDRKIDNFIFADSDDERITNLTVDSAQYTGETIYDVINDLCVQNNIGFKVVFDDYYNFVFSLYSGEDRSYDQDLNPYVIFSQKFENINNSDYMETEQSYKTVTLVAGEGEGSARKTAVVGTGNGLERREIYTDARDISSSINGGTLTASQYTAQLEQRGKEVLKNYIINKVFDGQIDTNVLFKYGEDFFIGDLILIADSYENEFKARITEIIHSQSNAGYEVYPSFEIIDEEET